MTRRHVIWIVSSAVVLLIAFVVLVVAYVPRALRSFFYPPAPLMPAIVSKTVPEILTELELVMKTNAPKVLEQMQPGLSDAEIARLEQQANLKLPDDIKALYRWHDGCRTLDPMLTGPVPGHRFVPLAQALGEFGVVSNQVAGGTSAQRAAYNIFAGHRKSWIQLFDDGAGDGYYFDPKRKPSEGAIFYCFAEDNTYLFFPSVANLLEGTLECYKQNAFVWDDAPSEAGLEEDFEKSDKIWSRFGARN